MALQPNIKVTIRSTTSATSNNQPLTLKSSARTISQLKDIADILEVDPTDGDTLVYNSALDKYEVRQLSSNNITITDLDGGTF